MNDNNEHIPFVDLISIDQALRDGMGAIVQHINSVIERLDKLEARLVNLEAAVCKYPE